MKRFLSLGMAVAWVWLSVSAIAQDFDYVPLERAWFDAQEKIRSGRSEVETKQTIDVKKFFEDVDDSVVGIPAVLQFTRTRSFVFKGSRLKVIDRGPEYDPRISGYKDATRTLFNDPRDAHNGVNLAAAHSWTFPIRLMRKYDPLWWVFKSSNCSLKAEKVEEQGLACYRVVEKKWRRTGDELRAIEAQYTICPERDYALVRYTAVRSDSGSANMDLQMEHQQDAPTGVWVPKGWTITEPASSETSTVTAYELNVDIADSEFLP